MMIGISLLLAFKQCLKSNVYTCTYSKYDVCRFEALKLVFIICLSDAGGVSQNHCGAT